MRLLNSWTITINGSSGGGSKRVDAWEDIYERLKPLRTHPGTMCLEDLDSPALGPVCIDLIAESNMYLVTLLEQTVDGGHVRSYWDPVVSEKMVDVLGDYWDARQITHDFDLVISLFLEFFQTGNVSAQWLS